MKYCLNLLWVLLISVSVGTAIGADETKPERLPSRTAGPVSSDQARVQARILHETIRGTLQVVHRDFFDDDDAHAIPSASLEDVFHELKRTFHVELRWLNVETDVLNVDHQPRDGFERDAAKAIAKGRDSFETNDRKKFRYAGRIRLASQCLKCHLKHRTTTDDRSAALLISIPLRSSHNALRSGDQ